jgi:hypothetical protein
MQNNKKKRSGWGSAIGWLIFILIFARGPITRLVQSALSGSSGTFTLPTNLSTLIPLAVAAVVVLTIAASAVRAIGGRRGQDERLPTGTQPPRPMSLPMPPFGGPSAPIMPPARAAQPSSPRAFTMPAAGSQQQLPTAPRFEPIISPRIVLLGIAGLVALGALGLFMLGLLVP